MRSADRGPARSDGSPARLKRPTAQRACQREPVWSLEKDDLRSERVLLSPAATDGERHAGLAMVRLGQIGTPLCKSDCCPEDHITLHEDQLPELTVLVELHCRKGGLSLAYSAA